MIIASGSSSRHIQSLSEIIIKKSIENLEYLLIGLIRTLTTKKEKIGLNKRGTRAYK